jgi:hypothetical protein
MGEQCVCHVQEALGLTQPDASRQLVLLGAAVALGAESVRGAAERR